MDTRIGILKPQQIVDNFFWQLDDLPSDGTSEEVLRLFTIELEKRGVKPIPYHPDGPKEPKMRSFYSWRELLLEACAGDKIVGSTLTNEEMDESFYPGYGSCEGSAFTAWSDDYVYFPICYDGSEWVGRAPRNISNEKCAHQGG